MHLQAPPSSQPSRPYCASPSVPDGGGGGSDGPCREPPHVLLILITGMSVILLVLAFLLILLVFSHLHFRHLRRRRRSRLETSPLPLPPCQPLPLETRSESLVLVLFPGEEEPTTFAKPTPRFAAAKGDNNDKDNDGILPPWCQSGDDDVLPPTHPTPGDGQQLPTTDDRDRSPAVDHAVNRTVERAVNHGSHEQQGKTDRHVTGVPVVATTMGLNPSPIIALDGDAASSSSSRLS